MNKNNQNGLTAAEVAASRQQHGANTLTPPKRTSLWRLYLEKYRDPIIQILLVAAAVSMIMAIMEDEYVETIGIFIAIFFATTIGFYFERDAAKKFLILTQISEEQPVKVIRDGQVMTIPRHEIVIGDVVLIETGDEIPADGILFKATDLQIDESSLTGEPLMTKSTEEQQNDDATYPRNMVLRSTMVMNGSGRYCVSAVGDATEIGKVARKSTEETEVKTPLSLQLNRLASLISKIGTAIAVLAFVSFLAHDIYSNPLWHTTNYIKMAEVVLRYFMMAVTLIVMAVPEGLPMAVTLALALNMRRMLKSNNLVRKLHACETMGAVTVICTDKTGTLTQNRMTVRAMHPYTDKAMLHQAIAVNTTAHLSEDKTIGNPTESALLLWLKGEGEDYLALRQQFPVTEQIPFSTQRKWMATLVDGRMFIKGAPEIILNMCDMDEHQRKEVEATLHDAQQHAMRTLAFATKEASDLSDTTHLELQAVCAISDPVREDVPGAVAECHQAGIDVKIVTGDTQATAAEIGREIGIKGDCITGPDFAALSDEEAYLRVQQLKVMSRARPTDKQRLVQLLQKHGEVVAVTGDGTNDAPALNYAHVGLSLGSGTSVAKNASDMTLIDDSFRSIVRAVEWGRSLYKNIQRFIFFQLIVNVTALLLVLIGGFVGTQMPLTITQILWVNLIMDTFAAMALASLPPSREVMNQPPRNQSDFIISKSMAWGILVIGAVFFLGCFGMLVYFGDQVDTRELTIFFTTFVMLQWWNLFNAKSLGSHHTAFHHFLWDKGLLLVLAIILFGQWVIVTFGGTMFRTTPLSLQEWLAIIGITSPVMIVGEIYRAIQRLIRR